MAYDVFISYSHADSVWVRGGLLRKLEERSFSVFIDFREFRGGTFSVEEMERAVVESRHTILVLSPAYMGSEWGKFENVMAQTLDPGALTRRLIPVLLADCNIPPRLRILHYIDLRRGDADDWERLFRDII